MVRKAVIPCAGLGTRFLPATLAVPKELLPIDRKPAIQHIVADLVECGVDTVVLVISRGKEALLHYFLDDHRLAGKRLPPELTQSIEELALLRERVNVVAVYQEKPLGLGHAVLCAAPVVGDEPFLLALPDDHFRASPTRQLVEAWEKYGKGAVALLEVPNEDVPRFGIVSVEREETPFLLLNDAVEKPTLEAAPSRLAIMGRYLFPPKVFEYLRNTPPGINSEIQLTDSMKTLAQKEGLVGVPVSGEYLDIGTWDSYVRTLMRLGLEDPAFREFLTRHLH